MRGFRSRKQCLCPGLGMLDQDGAAVGAYHNACRLHAVGTVSCSEAFHYPAFVGTDARSAVSSIRTFVLNSQVALHSLIRYLILSKA
jgi:hypothetical protein